jgi:tetratricopeptide (TPR) repeat protein
MEKQKFNSIKIKRGKRMKKLFIIFLLIPLAFCAPKKKIDITPKISDFEYKSRIEEADALYKRGNYSCLKEAFQAYNELLAARYQEGLIKEKLVKTALLLTLREKELGILESRYLGEATHLIQTSPCLHEFPLYLDIVNSIPKKTKGVIRDFIRDNSQVHITFDKLKKHVPAWNMHLKEKSGSDEFFTYLYISLNSELYYFIEEKPSLLPLLKAHPESLLIQYKLSLYQRENQRVPEELAQREPDYKKSLEELIQKEPRFYEINYFFGDMALQRKELVTAEKYFLKAYQQIPESSSTIISLANIYSAFEELKSSLEFYEEALKLAPTYRDALLGKAFCLSYLGRNEEAIETLYRLLRLGKYFMGETHYWLAWNCNELENLDMAWEYIEKAKNYIFGQGDIHTLAGIIAFKKGNLEVAEKNFKDAIKLKSPSCDASYYLGKVYVKKQEWKNSGDYFGRAAICYESIEKALNDKIEEIKNSAFSEERKEKHVLRNKIKLRKTILTKATCFYNAAAGFYNAGMREGALAFAKRATSHPLFKQRAEELILKIEKNL